MELDVVAAPKLPLVSIINATSAKLMRRLLDEHAFAHILAHNNSNDITTMAGAAAARIRRACGGCGNCNDARDFFTAPRWLVNACECRLAELYVSIRKFILRLFVSLLSH
jgi:hypothetical protein